MNTKIILAIFVILLVGFIAPFAIGFFSERPLTDDIRADLASGQVVTIEDGRIHYIDRGPKDGAVIVMVHGFSTPHFIFEQNAQALIAEGYRVIQFDHFGRGWSDRPTTVYDAAFYEKELLQFLDTLGLTDPIGLVGLSMGGAITMDFLANHPSRVSRLFLFVPAGLTLSTDSNSISNRILMTPVIGDWLWRLSARTVLTYGHEERQLELAEDNRLQGDLTEQMQYRGYFPALLSTYLAFPLSDHDESFVRASETGVPIMAVFGDADQVVSLESADRMKELVPGAQIEVIAGGTHGLNFENHELVNPMIVEFFSDLQQVDELAATDIRDAPAPE